MRLVRRGGWERAGVSVEREGAEGEEGSRERVEREREVLGESESWERRGRGRDCVNEGKTRRGKRGVKTLTSSSPTGVESVDVASADVGRDEDEVTGVSYERKQSISTKKA